MSVYILEKPDLTTILSYLIIKTNEKYKEAQCIKQRKI